MIDILATAEFAIQSSDTLLEAVAPDKIPMPAMRVPGREDALFARTGDGDFILLVECPVGREAKVRQTDSLRLASSGKFLLEDIGDGGAIESSFASVALLAGHDELLTSFGTLCAVLLAGLPLRPASHELDELIDDFIQLFTPRRAVGRDIVVGLWGELWLMLASDGINELAAGWHEETNGRFDFSLPDSRIEVKTTESALRVHHFSLAQLEEQLKPTWIASVRVVSDPSGESIGSLLSTLIDLLPEQSRARVLRVCLSTISGDLESVSDYRFAASGVAPLALVPADLVPRVAVPPGKGITDVHFRVDITSLAEHLTTSIGDLVNRSR